MPDGTRTCPRHTTEAHRNLIAEYDRRAVKVGIRDWDRIYGPNIDVAMRGRLLDWAEPRRLQLARPDQRFAFWGRIRQRFDHGPLPWADHATFWTRDGKPVLVVCQPYPYGIGPREIAQLARLEVEHPGLTVQVYEDGWYGYGTTFVGIWRNSEAYAEQVAA